MSIYDFPNNMDRNSFSELSVKLMSFNFLDEKVYLMALTDIEEDMYQFFRCLEHGVSLEKSIFLLKRNYMKKKYSNFDLKNKMLNIKLVDEICRPISGAIYDITNNEKILDRIKQIKRNISIDKIIEED